MVKVHLHGDPHDRVYPFFQQIITLGLNSAEHVSVEWDGDKWILTTHNVAAELWVLANLPEGAEVLND